jgi:fucose 4-O-acetylase-like acetyltransferase
MEQRLNHIDIAKGIGIILVVFSHTDYSDIVHYTLAFYVPIFFFCSGYTTSIPTNTSFKENFIKHAIKLLKPYLFFTIILLLLFRQFYLQGLVGIFYSRYCLYPFGSPDIYRFFINGNYPLWFLTCMTIAFFLFYLIIYQPKYQYYIGVSYLAISVLLSYLPILLPWSIDTAFLMALFMYIGMQMRQRLPDLFSVKIHPLIILSAIIYILSIPFCSNINLSVREYGSSLITFTIAGISGCLITIYIARLIEQCPLRVIFQQIGKHSLTIFCIEIPFILLGRAIADYLFIDYSANQTTQIATAIIETIIALSGGYLLSVLLQENEHIRKLIF